MTIAVYPGSFDPLTYGHIDIIRRSCQAFDKLIVGVLTNFAKRPLFSVKERIAMIQEACPDIPNMEVASFEGLVTDFCREKGARVIIRGVRSYKDFEYELTMAHTNRLLMPETDTMFLTARPEYSFVSSSAVRELVTFQGDLSAFVPDFVEKRIYGRSIEVQSCENGGER